MDFDDDPVDNSEDTVPSFKATHAAGDDTDDEIDVIEKRWRPIQPELPSDDPFEMAVRQAGTSSLQLFENQKRCWGCQHAILSPETQNRSEAQIAITKMIRSNHGRMTDSSLSMLVSDYHFQHVYQPAAARGQPCQKWTAPAVLDCIRHHNSDPELKIGEMIPTLLKVIRECRSKIIIEDMTTGERKIDAKTCDLMLRTIKVLTELYTKQPETMVFGRSYGTQTGVKKDDT